MSESKKYLLDSNSLMMPARQYYAYDLIPSYWKRLLTIASKEKNIILFDMIEDEINKGDDELKSFIKDHEQDFVSCEHKTSEVVKLYAEVIQYVQECGYYNSKGLATWSEEFVADPWLIAAAKVNNFTIVSFEIFENNLSIKNPSGKVKIPNVAAHFDVETINLYKMMRELKINI